MVSISLYNCEAGNDLSFLFSPRTRKPGPLLPVPGFGAYGPMVQGLYGALDVIFNHAARNTSRSRPPF